MRRSARLAAAVLLALAGCFPFDGGEVRLDGPYHLWAADVPEDMMLYHALGGDVGVGRVGPTVFAAGWDARHVIAKRHPDRDRVVTEYFILDRAKDGPTADPDSVVTGPLTAAEFAAARARLGVSPALAFTVVLRDLE
jgi:hypothetical protein